MAREKEGYREHLELVTRKLEAQFPKSNGMLTTEQVAEFLICTEKTVRKNINKKRNPLPAINIGVGRTLYRVPVTELARWSLG